MYKNNLKSNKNFWVLILFLLSGVVLGGFIGEYIGTVPFLSWLNYGQEFGLTSPLVLDLGVLKIQFALSLKFTIAGIIGIVISAVTYKFI